jgi:O-antigen/teichoic acid export membrane protein
MKQGGLLVKRIGLVGVTNLLVELSGLILLPTLTKNLSIIEYGMWVQIIVTVGLVPAVALLGLPSSMARFMAPAKNKEESREIFYSLATIIAFAALVASTLILAFSGIIASALFNGREDIVHLLSLLVFLECLIGIPFSYFRISQQIKKYSIFSIARICLMVLLVSYFVHSGRGIQGAVIGMMITAFMFFATMSIFVLADMGMALPRFRNLRNYLAFGMPTVPGNIAGWIVNSSNRYVLGVLLGASAVGYFSPSYALGNMISIFIAPISLILPTVLPRYYDDKQIDEVKLILSISLKYFLTLAIPSAFGLSILSNQMLVVLSTPDIASHGYQVTPFIALGAIFFGAYILVVQVIILKKKTALIGTVWVIAAVLNLGLSFILIPYIDILGAAIATLISFAFTFAVTAYYSNRYLKLEFDVAFTLKSILASIVMSILLVTLSPEGTQEIFQATIIGAAVYFTILILLRGITRSEIYFFKGLFLSH